MDSQARKTIPSGVEPVDRLMGGLEFGHLYLVHGEAPGKSLFGIRFLIEGLKRGEQGALVIHCSPEDAVRRFARLGYDCLEDVYSGRLVILEYSDDLIQQIARLSELTPALREIEWLLGETRPSRLVFDPVTSVVVSEKGDLESRVGEFAHWTKSFGATVLLIANAADSRIVRLFTPHVAELFRFEVREVADGATRLLAFEKALAIPDQVIEVDPSRGVFLSERPHASNISQATFFEPGPDFRLLEFDAAPPAKPKERPAIIEPEPIVEEALRVDDTRLGNQPPELDLASIEDALARLVEHNDREVSASPRPPAAEAPSRLQQPPAKAPTKETRSGEEFDLASELFGDLAGVFFPGDLCAGQATTHHRGEARPSARKDFERSSPHGQQPSSKARTDSSSASHAGEGALAFARAREPDPSRAEKRGRAADSRIDSAMAARAVEALLAQPKTTSAHPNPEAAPVAEPTLIAPAREPVDARSFNVLVIDDDARSSQLIAQSLGDFCVERVHDGVSALARLISYKPDLVVLDVDIPVVDGFKVLAHIRTSLDVPVIIVSGTLLRSSDRVLSTELGADYHLTKPFSAKELRQKARQLIARYRGIDSWIISSPVRAVPPERTDHITEDQHPLRATDDERFTAYNNFVAEVETRVKAVIENGAALSIVGCRVPQMITVHGDIAQSRLRELVRGIVRDTDLASTNAPGDVVILLADAGASGARAFASRLRETVAQKMNQDPSVWMRSFPELEEAGEAISSPVKPNNGGRLRRASDSHARE